MGKIGRGKHQNEIINRQDFGSKLDSAVSWSIYLSSPKVHTYVESSFVSFNLRPLVQSVLSCHRKRKDENVVYKIGAVLIDQLNE